MKESFRIAIDENGVLKEKTILFSCYEDAVEYINRRYFYFKDKSIYILCLENGEPLSGSQYHLKSKV